MEIEPRTAIALAVAAHHRVSATIRPIDDTTAWQPSRLPGWTVGHVVTHLARNADGHVRRLDGAGWPHADLLGDDHFPTSGSPLRASSSAPGCSRPGPRAYELRSSISQA
jgi:maleylpyruvate isomerase